MRRTLRSLVALAAAGLMVAALPGTAGAHNPPTPTPTPTATTVASFGYGGFPYGQFGGSMILGRDGRFVVALTGIGDASEAYPLNVGQVWTVDAHGKRATLGAPIQAGYYGVLTGLAQDAQGRTYVALANSDSADTPPGTPTFAPGIFRVDGQTSTRVATLPAFHFPDKMVFDDGYLYVADSFDFLGGTQGAVWRFRPGDHNVDLPTPWLLAPVLDPPALPGHGVTGIAVRGDWLWGVNHSTGTVFKTHINRDGNHGAVQTVLVSDSLVTADSLVFDQLGGLWITVTIPRADAARYESDYCFGGSDPVTYPNAGICGAIFRLSPTGHLTQVASDTGWLDYPTQAVPVVRPGMTPGIYVLNGSFMTGQPAIVAMKFVW